MCAMYRYISYTCGTYNDMGWRRHARPAAVARWCLAASAGGEMKGGEGGGEGGGKGGGGTRPSISEIYI
jgi:hypothetical protein